MEGFQNEEERSADAQRHTQDKLCVCFPLVVCECWLRWFTSTGDCLGCLYSSSLCQCPGNNLALQGSMLKSVKTTDFIHTCQTKCCRGRVVSNLAHGNLTDNTNWFEAKLVQTFLFAEWSCDQNLSFFASLAELYGKCLIKGQSCF